MLKPFAGEQDQLVFRERGVDMGQGDAVECQVPGGEPGIFPLVGHRHDVERVESAPPGIATAEPGVRRPGLGGVAVQPARHVVVVELLAPQHPGEGLAHHDSLVGGGTRGRQLGVELVGLGPAPGDHLVEVRSQRRGRLDHGAGGAQPQPQLDGRARRHGDLVPERAFRPAPVRIDRGRPAHDMVVDAVLGVRGGGPDTEEALVVGLVLAEQWRRRCAVRAGGGQQFQLAEERVMHRDRARPGRLQPGPRTVDVPGPGVAEPRGGQDVQGVRIRARVGHLDGHQDVPGIGLRVMNLDDPIAVAVEGSGVQELVLRIELAPPSVLPAQIFVRELCLRIVVAPPVPGVAGHGVEVPPVLLDVLAVVRLGARQSEGALLEDRVAPVPQRQAEAQPLLDVGEPGETVLSPPVRPGPGVVVREVCPCLAVGAVVLADGAPLPLADVRPPEVPVACLAQPVLELPEPARPFPLSSHRRPPSGHAPSPLGDDMDGCAAGPSSGEGEQAPPSMYISWRGAEHPGRPAGDVIPSLDTGAYPCSFSVAAAAGQPIAGRLLYDW